MPNKPVGTQTHFCYFCDAQLQGMIWVFNIAKKEFPCCPECRQKLKEQID